MATIRYGSTAKGKLTFGAPTSISLQPIPGKPVPPDPPDPPNPPDPPIPPKPPKPPMSTLTLRADNGQYVCAELDGSMVANRPVAGAWETFAIEAVDGGKFALKSAHGKYVCAEGGGGGILVANRDAIGAWETFRSVPGAGGGIALKTINDHFVCAEEGGGGEVNATRTAVGPWETFNKAGGGGGGWTVGGPGFKAVGRFWTTDSGRYVWRGATSFALPFLVATGRVSEAEATIADLRAEGFSLVRILTMAKFLFTLTPSQGEVALVRVLDLCRAAQLNVEVVALADTDDYTVAACSNHLRTVADLAAASGIAVLEGANEMGPVHSTQRPEIVPLTRNFLPPAGLSYCPGSVHGGSRCTDVNLMTSSQRKVYEQDPSKSPYWDEISAYSRQYGTSHLKRDNDAWNRTRRIRELEISSSDRRVPFVDDESLGYGPSGGKRETDPSVAYTQGVLSRIFEVGATFHSTEGLQSQPFGPGTRECARAFIEGTRVVPDTTVLDFRNAGWSGAPVQSFDTSKAVRVYTGISGNTGVTCALGVTGDPRVQWGSGWHITETVSSRPGVIVWRIAQ